MIADAVIPLSNQRWKKCDGIKLLFVHVDLEGQLFTCGEAHTFAISTQ